MFIFNLKLLVRCARIYHWEDCGRDERINTFVRKCHRLEIFLGCSIYFAVLNANMERAVLLGFKYDWRSQFGLGRSNNFFGEYFVYLVFFKFSRFLACPDGVKYVRFATVGDISNRCFVVSTRPRSPSYFDAKSDKTSKHFYLHSTGRSATLTFWRQS